MDKQRICFMAKIKFYLRGLSRRCPQRARFSRDQSYSARLILPARGANHTRESFFTGKKTFSQ